MAMLFTANQINLSKISKSLLDSVRRFYGGEYVSQASGNPAKNPYFNV